MSNDDHDGPISGSCETKRCTKCGSVKPVTEFYRHARRRDGLKEWCKPCSRESTRSWRNANREHVAAYDRQRYLADDRHRGKTRTAARSAGLRAELADFKLARGCADCGYCGHAEALDFDHLPGFVKLFTIGTNLSRSPRKVWDEVAKCDVVCANCHRIRTVARKTEAA